MNLDDFPSKDEYVAELEKRMKSGHRRHEEVIDALLRNPAGLSLTELIEATDLANNTVNKAKKELLEKGIIKQDPPEEEYEPGSAKRFHLDDKLFVEELREDWIIYTDLAMAFWKETLEIAETNDCEALKTKYSEVVTSLQGEMYPPMFDLPDDAEVEDLCRAIQIELYRFNSEKVFGETYIQSIDRDDKVRERLIIFTYRWANAVPDIMNTVWEESEAPNPTEEPSTSDV